MFRSLSVAYDGCQCGSSPHSTQRVGMSWTLSSETTLQKSHFMMFCRWLLRSQVSKSALSKNGSTSLPCHISQILSLTLFPLLTNETSSACCVSYDETALDYIKKFYTAEKLSAYNVAFQEFRDLWFEGKVSWKGYILTSSARERLDNHPCEKSEGKCVKMKPNGWMDPLFCFQSSYEESLEHVLGVELYPTIVI